MPQPRQDILDVLATNLEWKQDVDGPNGPMELTLALNNPTVADTVKWTPKFTSGKPGDMMEAAPAMVASVLRQEHVGQDAAHALLQRLGGLDGSFFYRVLELYNIPTRAADAKDDLSDEELAAAAETAPTA